MKRNFTLLLGLCAALLIVAISASGQENASSVSYDGKVYTFGGGKDWNGQPAASNDVNIFDPVTGENFLLQSYPPWPDARSGQSVIVNGDKMYIYGGKNANGVYLNDMWEFDMKNRTWKKIEATSSPMPRTETVQVRVGDVALVIGGRFFDGSSQSYVHALNLTTPTAWTMKAPMQEPLQSSGGFVYQGQVYILGGFLDDYDPTMPGKQVSYSANTQVYNPTTNSWQFVTTTGSVPEMAKFSTVMDNTGKAWVAGGVTYDYTTGKEVPLGSIGYFDPATVSWHYPIGTDILVNTSDAGMVFIPPSSLKSNDKGKLYIIGGLQPNGKITERIIEYDIATKTFKEVYHPSGIDQPLLQGFSLSLFPNPAKDQVNLSLTVAQSQELFISMVDLSGREVLKGPQAKEYTPGTHNLTLNISSLPAGIYALWVRSNSRTEIRKLIVK